MPMRAMLAQQSSILALVGIVSYARGGKRNVVARRGGRRVWRCEMICRESVVAQRALSGADDTRSYVSKEDT
jgi:hypothetical protein